MQNSLLFDGISTQGTSKNPFHGGGEYAKYILREALNSGYIFDIVFRNDLISDNDIMSLLSQFPKCNIIYVDNNKEVYDLIIKNGYNTFYSALPFNFKDFNLHNTKFIQVIHGLRNIELPWDFYRYKYYNNILMRFMARIISSSNLLQSFLKHKHLKETQSIIQKPNNVILTVSNHSKYSMINFFPKINHRNIKVFYSPFSNIKSSDMNDLLIKGDYYLMVNANRFEKNIYRSIKSFDKLISDGHLKDKTIVITGCDNFRFFNEIVNTQKFKLLPYVSSDEIESLYMNAYAFVYPSLNEGFGYPPLKAMGHGVPVIASSATSIPEICSNAALFFNPLSMDELSNRILQIEYSSSIRHDLIEKGYNRFNELLIKQKNELPIMLNEIFGNE